MTNFFNKAAKRLVVVGCAIAFTGAVLAYTNPAWLATTMISGGKVGAAVLAAKNFGAVPLAAAGTALGLLAYNMPESAPAKA